MKKTSVLDWIAIVLIIVGAINWGLVGLFGFNLIYAIFGTVLSRIIFVIVGISGVYAIFLCGKVCKK